MAEDRRDIWKMTSIGLVIAAIVAVVTGIVVANRTSTTETKVTAPSASPSSTVAQAPTTPAPAPATSAPASRGVPSQSAVTECNRVAAAQGGPERTRNDKIIDTAKDAGIGALGGAAVGALGGAAVKGGKGAGKGALIGGALGAGGGTLYGIWDNKKDDERYRAAYGSCMKSRGYTG